MRCLRAFVAIALGLLLFGGCGQTALAPTADRSPATSPADAPPGSSLPDDKTCAARVHPVPENKGMNAGFNARRGQQRLGKAFFPTSDDPRANSSIASRVDGNFTGTTDEILQWAACKWGLSPDLVRAQAAIESWWRQTTLGDWNADPAFCTPRHPLGKDDPQNHPGACPNSWGILQGKWYYEKPAWPALHRSTAFNADVAYAIWRACYEGYEWWLRDQPPNSGYAAGDRWGCVGRYFSGAWHTPAGDQYVARVRQYERERIWTKPYFQEP